MAIEMMGVLGRTEVGELCLVPGTARIPAQQKDSLLKVLDTARVVRGTTACLLDLVEPDRGDVVNMSIRTDGHWIWNDSVAYYLRHHDVSPPDEFVEFYRERKFEPRTPTPTELEEVEARLG